MEQLLQIIKVVSPIAFFGALAALISANLVDKHIKKHPSPNSHRIKAFVRYITEYIGNVSTTKP